MDKQIEPNWKKNSKKTEPIHFTKTVQLTEPWVKFFKNPNQFSLASDS